MTTENTKLPPGITQEMVKEAKEKYGNENVKIADLPKDEEATDYLSVLMRRPTRKAIGEFEKWADSQPDKAKAVLVKYSLLSHKDEVMADDGLFLGAFNAAVELMPVRKAIIKNC